MSDKKEKTLKEEKNFKSKLVYDGFHKIEKITRISKDEEIEGEVIKKGETVSGLIYNKETKKYIFIEKYKLAANGLTLEVINGTVEKSEKSDKAIKRIVTEMTGYKVDDVREINSYFMDTNNSDEVCTFYYVEVSEKVVDDLEFEGYNLVEIEKLGLGGKLFVNQDGEISIYSYPMNEYFECDDTMLNLSSLSFKAFIDMYVNRTIN